MDWLQSLLGSETAPAATAFVLGLLTALSPCQLAANIVAVAFIGGSIDDRKATDYKVTELFCIMPTLCLGPWQ